MTFDKLAAIIFGPVVITGARSPRTGVVRVQFPSGPPISGCVYGLHLGDKRLTHFCRVSFHGSLTGKAPDC